jgi:DNA helicase-2/ATP-dependent DNA helicase PcrA
MAASEIDLLSIRRGTVTAPAGCSKTHLISETLKRHAARKPILVLTHTNAGVAALRGRLQKAGISTDRFRLATIDGWAMRLIGMFPRRSGHDPDILNVSQPRSHYPAIRLAAAQLLKAGHVSDVLDSSYTRLIVDEYQDCSLVQHALVHCAAHVLPTCVLGDPMQAIFRFQGNELADWDEHVCVHFPVVGELATPWRWINAREQAFGEWLLDVRRRLVAGAPISLKPAPTNVTWVELGGTNDHERRLQAGRTRAPANGTVLILGDAINPDGQRQFASQIPGAVTVENVDLRDLITFARGFDLDAPNLLAHVVNFAQDIMTNVGAADLLQRVAVIQRGTARREPSETEVAALEFAARPSYARARHLLSEIGRQAGVRSHRPAILRACINTLLRCEDPTGPSPYEAAVQIREQTRAIGRPLSSRTVGSTLLLKGLEADVSVILNAVAMDRRHLYVAMTRGAKALVVCAPSSTLQPAP